jgi:hypothetical protein
MYVSGAVHLNRAVALAYARSSPKSLDENWITSGCAADVNRTTKKKSSGNKLRKLIGGLRPNVKSAAYKMANNPSNAPLSTSGV